MEEESLSLLLVKGGWGISRQIKHGYPETLAVGSESRVEEESAEYLRFRIWAASSRPGGQRVFEPQVLKVLNHR